MTVKLPRGHVNFKLGISSVDQLSGWLKENNQVTGIAMLGRSNVGKSSLINSLFGGKTARTSKTPGRTREINIFSFELSWMEGEKREIKTCYLFDLPGYGHADVSKEMSKNWDLLMSSFFENLSPKVVLVGIQDSRHPHQKSDQKFNDFLGNTTQPRFLVFNKIDKLKTQKERAKLQKIKPQIYEDYKNVQQIYFVSAEKKTNVPELEQGIVNFLLQ
ncbi:MAG: ribosome biogenesis GTP-binding protein YsxC [Bacteriovoracaceae bacterium]|jgi:GTP-binding protein|nr:ribosome biogenesis GTP-binding protein YsxC [Bacteriovoracaceae bacterium]